MVCLSIGNLTLPLNVIYAPMAGCTDFPFRKIACRYKPGLLFCEMVNVKALLHGDEDTFRMLHYQACMRPIGAQICGSDPKLAASAARIIEDLGFDLVDLNCGCPVDKVTRDGSGSGLLKNPLKIGEIVSSIIAAVRIPVTVKIRLGWDAQHLVHTDVVRVAELAGAKAVTVHGRTRAQGYSGRADWEKIGEAKQAARSIPVIGNGDIVSAEDAVEKMRLSGCDGVLVARGLYGKPFLADDIRKYYEQGTVPERNVEEIRSILIDHFQETVSYCTDERAIVDMKRVGCWYTGGAPGARVFREALNRASSLEEMKALIRATPIV